MAFGFDHGFQQLDYRGGGGDSSAAKRAQTQVQRKAHPQLENAKMEQDFAELDQFFPPDNPAPQRQTEKLAAAPPAGGLPTDLFDFNAPQQEAPAPPPPVESAPDPFSNPQLGGGNVFAT